jgi:two-component system, chemotaxis family, chemotaxis protein CheY
MTGILIIEDNPEDMLRAHEILTSYGYHISGQATDGLAGISLYREKRPDLVIIDLILTGMNGIEVLRAIKAEFPDAQTILCTASGQGSIIDLAMRAGANGYVVKPYDPEILLSAVSRITGSPK